MRWREESIARFTAALAAPGPAPAAGAAAAAACAFAAALVALAEGGDRPDSRRAADLSAAALAAVDDDEAGYTRLAQARRDPDATAVELAAARAAACEAPFAVAEAAAELVTLAGGAERRAPPARRADATAAAELARAACLASVALVEANLEPGDPELERARVLAARVKS
jgi:formiminotetrahydrofolate cyclodeaminase